MSAAVGVWEPEDVVVAYRATHPRIESFPAVKEADWTLTLQPFLISVEIFSFVFIVVVIVLEDLCTNSAQSKL